MKRPFEERTTEDLKRDLRIMRYVVYFSYPKRETYILVLVSARTT